MIILIDMQEKLLGAMPDTIGNTISRQKILLESVRHLGVSTVITEQYPQGLGATSGELSGLFDPSWPVFEKTSFSCLGSAEVRMELEKKNINTLILAGIEAHVCVLQTAVDSVARGLRTIILKDAVNSRKAVDFETGLDTAKAAGAHLMSVESLLFMFMRDSSHPAFRTVSRLLR